MTRIATLMETGPASAFSESLAEKIRSALGETPSLVMAFASTKQPLAEVTGPLARNLPQTTVLGASTAGEFTEAGDAKGSCAVFALGGDYKVFSGMSRGLAEDPQQAVATALDGLPREVAGYPHCTGILLLDPLAGNGEEATLITATLLGPSVKLAGGAAGDDLRMTETWVASGAEAASDAVVVALIHSRAPLAVGIDHGHSPLSGELEVTEAGAGVVKAINGRPAWDVWLEETSAAARAQGLDPDGLKKDAETGYLLRFEAGLAVGSEYKIRAPLSRAEDGSISFACGLPTGSRFRITESTPERQIQSAVSAARRAREQIDGQVAGAVVFDCICRNLILGTSFADAVKGMARELGDVPLAGFETYGEIALDVGDFSGFHNTTSVVLAFPKG